MKVPSLIQEVLNGSPSASIDGIVKRLNTWGVQVSGIIVAMCLKTYSLRALGNTLDLGNRHGSASRESLASDEAQKHSSELRETNKVLSLTLSPLPNGATFAPRDNS